MAQAPSGNVTVMANLVTPEAAGRFGLQEQTVHRWNLLRLDVRNMSKVVNHHFDYKIDGHTRKYELHCEANSSQEWRVYLIRETDLFHIPYQVREQQRKKKEGERQRMKKYERK